MKIRKIVSRSRTPLVVPFCHNTHIRQFKKKKEAQTMWICFVCVVISDLSALE